MNTISSTQCYRFAAAVIINIEQTQGHTLQDFKLILEVILGQSRIFLGTFACCLREGD